MTNDPDSLIADFWTQRSAAGGASAARFHDEHTYYDRPFLAEHCRPSSRILDLGCGTLSIANWLAADVGATVHGVDSQAAFLREAIDHPGLTTELADVRTYEPEGEYDVILLFGVIQHIVPEAARDALYARCAMHLPPGGKLLVKSQFGMAGDVEVDGYSPELGCHYYSLYPSLVTEEAILARHFMVTEAHIYPPELSPHSNTAFRHLICTTVG